MSSTMLPPIDHSNASLARSTEHGRVVPRGTTAERSEMTPVAAERTAAEIPTPLLSHQHACTVQVVHGFVVLDARGEFLAWCECIVAGKARLDGDPLARTLERCSDGVLMAWKHQKKFAKLREAA